MANWKKMAEAFGRAMNRPGATEKGRELVQNSNTWKHRAGDVQPRGDDTPAQRGMKEGWRRGEDDYYGAKDLAGERGLDPNDPKVREQMADEIIDNDTDAALEQEFDKEFKSAIERRKQGVKDSYGKGYPKDMAQEGADTFEKDLWNVIEGLRATGMSGNDILNMLKGK